MTIDDNLLELTIEELQVIEAETGVIFTYDWPSKTIVTKGKPSAIDLALERIRDRHDEVAELLRQRQPAPEEEIVERVISCDVPSKAVHRENYIRWYLKQPKYYHPTGSQLDTMFAACSEGDEIIFDFAHSFTVRKPNGLLVQVDRQGKVTPPSPYSPAARSQKEKA